jgi:hypothetical protein
MIIDHPHGLHKGIADGRSYETKALFLQVVAHDIGLFGSGGNLFQSLPVIDNRLVVHELPDVRIEASVLPLNLQESSGIPHRSVDLQSVTNYARVGQQPFCSLWGVMSNLLSIETVEGFPVVFSALQNSQPAQAGLCTLQEEELE